VVVGGWGEEEEEGVGGAKGLYKAGPKIGGVRQESAMEHADNNKGDHDDQRVSLWMPSAIELVV
jgi:hypothetical protein